MLLNEAINEVKKQLDNEIVKRTFKEYFLNLKIEEIELIF